MFKKITRWVPKTSLIIFLLGIAAVVCHIGFCLSASFADRFNLYVSAFLRTVTAKLTGWIPVSLAETIILSLPVTLTVIFVVCLRKSAGGKRQMVRCIMGVLSIAVLLYVLFVFTFAPGYRAPTLDTKLDLEWTDVSAEELYNTAKTVTRHLNELADQVYFAEEIGSVRTYSHKETVEKCMASYEVLAEEYDFLPVLRAPVKQITMSGLMTYTHISGMYTFFTGEANLNTNYPYFVNVYSTAHEMAHQRGIARENEANFIAYLVCIHSDDPYMQYSGYLNMYEYLTSPLYAASPRLYTDIVNGLDSRVRYDLQCYSEFFEKYRDNVASEVSNAVNNTYLVLQGQEEGAKSYGMVVDLAVAYHKKAGDIQ
ncbi:MAG: DUF3810 domain-containing protein [Clostridia bacterium]|nr:DUF3810 domain-containing protein [Clostridia bacterium]